MLLKTTHHFTDHLLAVIIILGFGIALGWVLHHLIPKTRKVKPETKVIDYPFEEWDGLDGYHEIRSKVFHNK